jgi:hypothetical protein
MKTYARVKETIAPYVNLGTTWTSFSRSDFFNPGWRAPPPPQCPLEPQSRPVRFRKAKNRNLFPPCSSPQLGRFTYSATPPSHNVQKVSRNDARSGPTKIGFACAIHTQQMDTNWQWRTVRDSCTLTIQHSLANICAPAFPSSTSSLNVTSRYADYTIWENSNWVAERDWISKHEPRDPSHIPVGFPFMSWLRWRTQQHRPYFFTRRSKTKAR